MFARRLIAGAILTLSTTAGMATDLMQVWEATRQHDPQGAVSEATRAAGAARRDQADALWRPQVGLTVGAGWANADSQVRGAAFSAPDMPPSSGVAFSTSITGGSSSNRWSLNARQPLYNPERSAQSRQLQVAALASEQESKMLQQNWMLHTAQRYFEVVLAERRISLIGQQQHAVDKALTEAKDRFALGDAPITDTLEAQARAQALQAQALAAQNALITARKVLADASGLDVNAQSLQAPAPEQVAALTVSALEPWLTRAEQHNPMLQLQQAQLDAAQQEANKYRLQSAPTLDLVAQASREELTGSGDFGTASNSQSQQMVGLMLNVPLYTGGWRSAKLQESLQLEEKARAELARTRQQVGQMTHAAWLAVQSGQAQLSALQAARNASQERLAATQLGRQVGDRTTLDLLNAQNDATAAELAVLQASVDLLIARLQLESLAGQLDVPVLSQINSVLR
jgi:outer membrane protein